VERKTIFRLPPSSTRIGSVPKAAGERVFREKHTGEWSMKFKLHELLPVSAAVIAFAVLSGNAAAGEVVKIGHVDTLTGGSAHLGKDNGNGARRAIEEINAKGLTIDGQRVTLALDGQDDDADARQVTRVAQKPAYEWSSK
jgi:hypothetical protein